MLQSMGSQKVRHDLETKPQPQYLEYIKNSYISTIKTQLSYNFTSVLEEPFLKRSIKG